jgi:hypothetical protein
MFWNNSYVLFIFFPFSVQFFSWPQLWMWNVCDFFLRMPNLNQKCIFRNFLLGSELLFVLFILLILVPPSERFCAHGYTAPSSILIICDPDERISERCIQRLGLLHGEVARLNRAAIKANLHQCEEEWPENIKSRVILSSSSRTKEGMSS